ncbi:helix-turn-helix transcriptional regulator [Rubrivirga marina]|uniref:Uncharacterized protein n=1 Tax=Rubrivirga marina TaxID=1196024 RepID=A0A271IV49_9BACT|nr:helix-turn-helix domain-containing protein [Rubrivirga marina]PAP75072.1 hypothetical protein BSZ37_00705 [Rubrivirga marina]
MDFRDLHPALQAFLIALVAEAVRPAVADALTDALPEVLRRASIPTYLSRQEVLALTGWSDRHLSYLQSEGQIPFLKRGRTVRFRADDIEAYLMEGYVVPKGRGRGTQ